MKNTEKFDNADILIRDIWLVMLGSLKKILLLTSTITLLTVIYSLSLNNIYQSKAVYLLKEDIQYSSKQDISGLVPFNIGTKDNYHMNYIKSVLKSRDFFKTLYLNDNFIINTQAASGYNEVTKEIIYDESLVNLSKKEWLTANGESLKPLFGQSFKNFNDNFSSNIDLGEGKISLSFNHYSPYYSKEALLMINDNLNSYIRIIKSAEVMERKDFLDIELKKTSIPYIKNNLSQLMLNEIEKQVFYSNSGNIYFDTIDKPSHGERFAPKRTLMVFYSIVLGFIFSSTLLIVINFIRSPRF